MTIQYLRHALIILVTLTICFNFSFADTIGTPNTLDVFKNGDYIFNWSIDETDLTIKVDLDVKTTGWVGFGLSKEGQMSNSDTVMCYYSTSQSKAVCVDGWADSRNAPPSDESLGGVDNLSEVSGSVADGTTKISFTRKLDTGDSKDLAIEKGKEMNVIFSYREDGSPETEEGKFLQHSDYSSKKIVLYGEDSTSDSSIETNNEDTWAMEIKYDSYEVPADMTTYTCKFYDLNTLVSKQTNKEDNVTYHAIRIEPIVENENLVHHMILYGCNTDQVELPSDYFSCPSMPIGCDIFSWAWTPGTATLNLPEEAGIVWGTYDTSRILLQIHYNNEENIEDVRDSSGAKIYYTTQLRKYDSGVMILGKPHKTFGIPAGKAAYEIQGECRSSCTTKLTDSIKVFAYMFHGHELMRKISTSFEKPDGTADFTWTENNYSFAHQTIYILDEPVELNKGFKATTICTYNTESKTEVTKSGETTDEEMCYNFVQYYPRENGIRSCMEFQNNDFCKTNEQIDRVLSEFTQSISKLLMVLLIYLLFN
jgi:hypothetical protein